MFQFFIEINRRIMLILLLYGIIMSLLRRQFFKRIQAGTRNRYIVNGFNLIGTPVHEFGHFIFAILFGMKVTQVCFYRTLKNATDGRLGYVTIAQKRGGLCRYILNVIGSFFVGIGPLLMGPSVLILFYYCMPKQVQNLIQSIKAPEHIKDVIFTFNAMDWFFLLFFLYAFIGISLNLELSHADIRMAWKGFFGVEAILLLISFILFFAHVSISVTVFMEISSYLIAFAGIGIIGAFLGIIVSFLLI